MKYKKQNIRYEFFKFSSSTTPVSTTLVLNDPASVQFFNVSTFVGGQVTINNAFTLDSINAVAPTNPNNLILKNNINEFDSTNYSIILQPGTLVTVIVKYYVNTL